MQRTVIAVVNATVSAWLDGATPEQVGLALTYGYMNVSAVESLAHSTASVPTVIHQPVEIAQAKGARGEQHVLDALRDEFHCEKVTGRTASGDFTVWFDNVKLCVEVKNYGRAVPAAEITKFLRDIETTGALAGLFISLGSRITGITDNFDTRLHPLPSGDMVPLIYVVSDDRSLIVNSAKMVLAQARARREALRLHQSAHAEVRNVDRMIDMCAHARLQIYELAGATSIALAKVASSIQTAEGVGRECIERVGGVDTTLGATDHVQMIVDALPGHWTSTAKRRNHPSGIYIDLGKKIPQLILPAVAITNRLDACLELGGSVTRDGASVPITDATIAGCVKLIK